MPIESLITEIVNQTTYPAGAPFMTIVFDDRYIEHVQTFGHPESPDRLVAIRDALKRHGLWKGVTRPSDATDEEIGRIHTAEYLESLNVTGDRALTMDTVVHPATISFARLAAGGSVIAAEKAWSDRKPSIALVRPPGHHAGPYYGMGFCYLNNIAIAAEQMIKKARKIAIVDIDVHHGNGTQDIFYRRPDVLYISMHQSYIFPGTGYLEEIGEGDGKGYTINIPLYSGAGDASFGMAMDKVVIPALDDYDPEIVLVSLGGDAHYRDTLASLSLSSAGYAAEVSDLLDFAKRRCFNRIAFFLEGGYDLESLCEVVSCTVGQFEGREIEMKYTKVRDTECQEREAIEEVVGVQKHFWKLQ